MSVPSKPSYRINSLAFPSNENQSFSINQTSDSSKGFIKKCAEIVLLKSPEVEKQKQQTLQERIGDRLSTAVDGIAPAVERKLKAKLEDKLGSKIGPKLVETLQKVVNSGLTLDQLTSDVVGTLEQTSPQQIGETLNVVTLFLRKYQEVFARVTAEKEQGRLTTQADEDAFWNEAMAEFSVPSIYAAIEADHDVHLSTLESGILNPRLRFKSVFEAIIKSAGGPKAVEEITEWQGDCKTEMHHWEPDVKGSFVHEINNQLDALAGHLREIFGIELTPENPEPIQDHCFLVERVGTREIVFYSSPAAQAKGIYPGMEAQVAEARWNYTKKDDEPSAVLINDNFYGRKPIREKLREIVFATLTQPSNYIYNRICERLLAIPFVGRSLAVLFKVLAWLGAQTRRGMNYFVGLPSRAVLADEITSNIMLHISNPTFFATPLLVVDRLFQTLESRATGTAGTAIEHQEAFVGEFVLEIGSFLNTICPSLFRLRTSRIVRAYTYVALWAFRKIGLKLLVNGKTARTTRRYFRILFSDQARFPEGCVEAKMQMVGEAITWARDSALTLRRSRDLRASAFTVLRNGYRLLGEFGLVSKDQTHFAAAGQSLAHLIHHTVIAAARTFITIKYQSSHHRLLLQMQELRLKMEREQPLTPEDLGLLLDPLNEKHEALATVELPRAQELRALANSIPELDLNGLRNFLEGINWKYKRLGRELYAKEISEISKLKELPTKWEALQAPLEAMAQAQKSELGEVDPELSVLQGHVREMTTQMKAIATNLEKLISDPESTTKEQNISTLRELEMAFHRHNRLRMQVITFFDGGVAAINTQLNSLQQQMAGVAVGTQLEPQIAMRLRDSEVATFATNYAEEERRLESQLQEIETTLNVINNRMHASRAAAMNDPRVIEQLNQTITDHKLPQEDQVPGKTVKQSFFSSLLFDAPSTQVEFKRSLDWHMELHRGNIDNGNLQQLAHLYALKYALRQKLRHHRAWTKAKVVLMDPAWILAQSGEQMIALAKKMIPGGLVKAYMDGLWVKAPVVEESVAVEVSAPAATPTCSSSEQIVIAASSNGAQPVYAPQPPVPRAARLPSGVDYLTNYFEEMALYRLANLLRDAVRTAV